LVVALIQTMSLFANFHVLGSVSFQSCFSVFVLFYSAVFSSIKFSTAQS